ncbi:MAG: hypothetical protein DRG63_03745 [Deltaproteobacteria bacterium]|nr:MAG: hypothetical protein DRG63_03745 [Deltaproteobacteria bacterium]
MKREAVSLLMTNVKGQMTNQRSLLAVFLAGTKELSVVKRWDWASRPSRQKANKEERHEGFCERLTVNGEHLLTPDF